MAQTFSTELAGIDSVPAVKPSATQGYGARLKRFRATITLAAQASGDTIVLADLPAGFLPAFFVITPSVSLGTATIALGNSSSATAYSPATAYTATTPTMAGGSASIGGSALSATTRVLATIGTAALPGSGTLVIDTYASLPN